MANLLSCWCKSVEKFLESSLVRGSDLLVTCSIDVRYSLYVLVCSCLFRLKAAESLLRLIRPATLPTESTVSGRAIELYSGKGVFDSGLVD